MALLLAAPYLVIIGLLFSTLFPSHTTNDKNYEERDKYVSEHILNEKRFEMLPNTLPDNIKDINYLYNFEAVIFDKTYLTLEISWVYNDETDYKNAKIKMQEYEPIHSQVVEDGFQMFYAIGNKKDDKQRFCFGYDDATKRVTYQIYYE